MSSAQADRAYTNIFFNFPVAAAEGKGFAPARSKVQAPSGGVMEREGNS